MLARPEVGVQFHGCWDHYDDVLRSRVLDKIAAAGMRWIRLDVAWDGIEDTRKGARNGWYLRTADYCVDQARARGLKVLVTLWCTPAWARAGGSNRTAPSNPQDYADFARWAAGHWAGRVAAWEVWNEPDPHQSFFQGTVAQYAGLLRSAYPAFKAGDPACKVVLGGPSSNDNVWLRDLYSRGVAGSFDCAATHPYQGVADAPPEHADDGHRWWFTHLPYVRRAMTDFGDHDKPIWFTEFGWSAHANWDGIPNWQRGVTPEQQADYLERALRYVAARWPRVPVVFWYKEIPYPGSSNVHEEGYALMDYDLTERPAYRAARRVLT